MPSSQQKHCRTCAAPAYCTHHGALLPAPTASNSVKVLLCCYHLSWLASLQSEHCSWMQLEYVSSHHHVIAILSSYYHIMTMLSSCYHCMFVICFKIHPSNWHIVLLCLQLTLKSFHGLRKIHRSKAVETVSLPVEALACFKRSWSVSFSCGPTTNRVYHFVRKSFNRSEVEIQIPDSALSSPNISQLDAQKNVNHRKTAVLRVYLTCLLKLESNGIGFCELRKGLCTC